MNIPTVSAESASDHFAQDPQFLREQLASLLWNSNDAVILYDLKGQITSWNPGAERLLGYGREDACRLHMGSLFPPARRDEAAAQACSLMRGETVPDIETQCVTGDGRVLDVELKSAACCDAQGQVAALVCIIREITQYRQLVLSLRDRQERLRTILDTAADAIITTDCHGTITDINHATERMFGYTPDQLLGHNVRLLMPPPYCDEHDAHIARFLQTGKPHIIGIIRELVGRRSDGSVFPIDLTINQVDHLGMFTGIIRDISQRRELQKQVLEIAAEEQRRIGQELHDGTGQELTGLALFAGTLVTLLDDLPRPTSDGGAAWQLDDSDLRQLRQMAARLSHGLADAHRHVQHLSRGIMPVQVEPQGLQSALNELAASTDALMQLNCQFECPGDVLVTNNNMATQLYRIAQEAVSNAVRHSHADAIAISLTRTDRDVVLEISDNGTGLDLAHRPRGSSGNAGGFGLDIMNYRADLIGGTLRILSRDGGGTWIRCTVPCGCPGDQPS